MANRGFMLEQGAGCVLFLSLSNRKTPLYKLGHKEDCIRETHSPITYFPLYHPSYGNQDIGYLHGSERVTAQQSLADLHVKETKPSGKSCSNKA